jgi:DNA-binding transcriptional MerR regulator/protein-L-isoaspartate O-methyltransferase
MTKDGYYTSGEFAKKANVTLRTVRYYDRQGILKPSKVAANGYRLYTDADFAKLQKILSLKYLGFSLEEIMTMTINDKDKDFMKESIGLQLHLVQKKMEHLKMVEQSLKDTAERMELSEEIDWNEVIHLLHVTNMDRSLVEQYKNASNLNIRIGLHQKYSQNPESWFPWIFRHLDLKPGEQILEIGCGNGELWKGREGELPEDVHIILSDQSSGMVEDAKKNMNQTSDTFTFETFDCRRIPKAKDAFHKVIANHLLFYLEDRQEVLREIRRVLKPGGLFVCSTYGRKHMQEITQLMRDFDDRITLSANTLYDEFGLENGEEQLSKVFSETEEVIYEDELLIDQPEPLISYILSCHGNQHEYLNSRYLEFKEFVRKRIASEGRMKITKSAGIFLCR